MKTTKLLISAVAVAAAVAVAEAQGQTLSATLVEITPGLAVTGTLDNGSYTPTNPAGVSHFMGFDGFCVDPLQSLSYDETLIYQVQDPASLGSFHMIAKLIGGYLSSPRSDEDAAAVQWAIWETTNETLLSPSLLDGNVRIIAPSLSTATLANQYLDNVDSFTPVTLSYLTNPTRQDILAWGVPGVVLVPEPTSAAMAALGGLLLVRRRRY